MKETTRLVNENILLYGNLQAKKLSADLNLLQTPSITLTHLFGKVLLKICIFTVNMIQITSVDPWSRFKADLNVLVHTNSTTETSLIIIISNPIFRLGKNFVPKNHTQRTNVQFPKVQYILIDLIQDPH